MRDDATNIEGQIRRLELVYEQLAAELRRPDVVQRLQNAPAEAEWSTMEILGHMTEMIPYWSAHCRTIGAAIGAPPTFGRGLDAPERLEGVERGKAASLDEALDRLRAAITHATDTMRSLSPEERGKKGIHIQRGEVTVADIIESFIVTHAEIHLAQIRQALKA
jgi:hypothetical protein